MRPKSWSYTPADDDTDGFGNDLVGTSGVAFVLTATTAADSLAHKVIITPSGSVTGNYSITGTDADGRTQTETLATDTTNAVTSAKYYKTLTSILAPSGIGAETVDIGWTDDIVTPTILLNHKQADFKVRFNVIITGTIDYSVQQTLSEIRSGDSAYSTWNWLSHGSVVAKTTSQEGYFAVPVTAMRVLINSLTTGATFKILLVQE